MERRGKKGSHWGFALRGLIFLNFLPKHLLVGVSGFTLFNSLYPLPIFLTVELFVRSTTVPMSELATFFFFIGVEKCHSRNLW